MPQNFRDTTTDIKFHNIRDVYKSGLIQVDRGNSNSMIVDLLMKNLGEKCHRKFTKAFKFKLNYLMNVILGVEQERQIWHSIQFYNLSITPSFLIDKPRDQGVIM